MTAANRQIAMPFADSRESAAARTWLGLAVDNRRLFDALAYGWLRPAPVCCWASEPMATNCAQTPPGTALQ